MKTTNRFITAIVVMLLLFSTTTISAQDEESKTVKYYVITTLHWNMDMEDFDMDTWKATEKEYLDKVTKNNENILVASFYLHHTTADNTELLYVQGFESWSAIEDADKRNDELAKEAWPNEAGRKAYFKKQRSYYSSIHSDEIYAALPGTKYLTEAPKDGMILYLRKAHAAFPSDGSPDERNELRDSHVENIINKNEYIKGWYPLAHFYGSDSRERLTATFFDSMQDLGKHYDRNAELTKEAWPDEAERKVRGKKADKYWTGVHGDYIYTFVGDLHK
jgi:hypothetical protein